MTSLPDIPQPVQDAAVQLGTQAIAALGKQWIENTLKNSRASEKAETRMMVFVSDLLERVRTLENQKRAGAVLDDALTDPDFLLSLRSALMAASRTSNYEKHVLLSRLVFERLQTPSEGIRALITARAIETIPHLTSNQLLLLALAHVVYFFRPISALRQMTEDEQKAKLRRWWDRELQSYLPGLEPTALDYQHLASLGCITHQQGLRAGVREMLTRMSPAQIVDWPVDGYLEDSPIGRALSEIWRSGLIGADLTSLGSIIGVYVHLERTGEAIEFPGW